MNNPVLCGSTRSTPGPGFAHGRAAGRGWNGWWRTWAASTPPAACGGGGGM